MNATGVAISHAGPGSRIAYPLLMRIGLGLIAFACLGAEALASDSLELPPATHSRGSGELAGSRMRSGPLDTAAFEGSAFEVTEDELRLARYLFGELKSGQMEAPEAERSPARISYSPASYRFD